MGGRAWTARELLYLRTHYHEGDAAGIADELGRSIHAVDCKASRLGLAKDRPWTEEERLKLCRLAPRMSWVKIGQRLDRTTKAVKHEAHRLGLRRQRTPVEWTEERVALLEELYPDHTAAEVAERLGVPEKSVQDKVSAIGLRKTRALTPEAAAVLWELRELEGVVEYVSATFGVGKAAVRRRLDELEEEGGLSAAIGNLQTVPLGLPRLHESGTLRGVGPHDYSSG